MTDENAVFIFATLTAAPGRGTSLRLALEELVAATRREEGNLEYTLHESANAPGTFLVYEIYRNQDAADTHMNSAHFKAAMVTAGPLLGSPPVIVPAKRLA